MWTMGCVMAGESKDISFCDQAWLLPNMLEIENCRAHLIYIQSNAMHF